MFISFFHLSILLPLSTHHPPSLNPSSLFSQLFIILLSTLHSSPLTPFPFRSPSFLLPFSTHPPSSLNSSFLLSQPFILLLSFHFPSVPFLFSFFSPSFLLPLSPSACPTLAAATRFMHFLHKILYIYAEILKKRTFRIALVMLPLSRVLAISSFMHKNA